MDEKRKLFLSVLFPVCFILLLWIIRIGETLFSINLTHLGVLPHSLHGLVGIITAPLIHSGFSHLLSNTLPLLLLGIGILYFYPKSALKVFLCIYIVPGIFVWFFARPAYHIGASGLIYGFVSFLFFSGIIRRDTRSIALALVVTFLYGSIIWGIIPQNSGISWEYHLFGSLTGIVSAFTFRNSDPYKRYEWEDEEGEEDGHNLEISHDRDDKI
jgi:membrane associated rhomboid family serine protease